MSGESNNDNSDNSGIESDLEYTDKIVKDKFYGTLFGLLIEDVELLLAKNLLINCNLLSKQQSPILLYKSNQSSNSDTINNVELPLLVLMTILNQDVKFHISAEMREYQYLLEYYLHHDVCKPMQLSGSLSLISDVLNDSQSYDEGLRNIPDEYQVLYSILAGAKYGLTGLNQEKLLQLNTVMIMKVFDKFWTYYCSLE